MKAFDLSGVDGATAGAVAAYRVQMEEAGFTLVGVSIKPHAVELSWLPPDADPVTSPELLFSTCLCLTGELEAPALAADEEEWIEVNVPPGAAPFEEAARDFVVPCPFFVEAPGNREGEPFGMCSQREGGPASCVTACPYVTPAGSPKPNQTHARLDAPAAIAGGLPAAARRLAVLVSVTAGLLAFLLVHGDEIGMDLDPGLEVAATVAQALPG